MPVFDTAAAIARNLDRTPTYQKGKALRLAMENKALVNQALEQEIEMAPEVLGLKERAQETREGELGVRLSEYYLKAGEAQRERTTNAAASAMKVLEQDPSAVAEATDVFSSMSGEKAPEGFAFTPEVGEVFLATAKRYEEVAASNAKETTHQKVVADLVSSGAIDQETGDQLLLDIEKKAGTVTGTTSLDPSQLSQTVVGQITKDYRGKVAMAATGAASATELVNISYQSPAALAKSGAIINFGNEIQKTAKNLMEVMNPDPLPSSETEKQTAGYDSFDWTELDKKSKKLGLSIENAARFKSGIYSIAFSAAVGEQGSRPSDKDIQWYIDIYGGGITDGKVFRATIATAMRRQYNMLKFTAELNPEIKDSAASLAVFEKPYNEFLSAIEGGKRITPPETAIQHLKEHPELADQFKKKYGFLPEGI